LAAAGTAGGYTGAVTGDAGGAATGSNARTYMEVVKPAIFNGEAGKVGGFITVCRLFLRMKLRGTTVEEQVQ